jgi:hypothetical protein
VIEMLQSLAETLRDVAPIVFIIMFFQFGVLRRPLKKPLQTCIGLIYVVLGLTLFMMGLKLSLFGIGETMASQLTAESFIGPAADREWYDYYWVYLFAAAVGFSTTVAEPALIAVAQQAEEQSGGALRSSPLRTAVAIGVSIGITLGVFRIVTGTPIHWYIIAGYVVVMLQTLRAPKFIIPLAFDSGGVTTSTVTVPVVAALGIELASSIPGRSPLIDGFGLIAFASLFPMMTVMAYAQLSEWRYKQKLKNDQTE